MKLIDKLAAVAASVTLAITFVAAGLFVCAGPNLAAETLAGAFSGTTNDETPFTREELVDMAVATKEFCFDEHDEAALYTTIARINQQAIEDGRLNPNAAGAPRLDGAMTDDGSWDTTALATSFSQASEKYVLSPDAVSHLDDVFYVIDAVRIPLLLIAAFAVAAAAHVGVRAGRKPLGGVFIASGTGLLAVLALLGAWAFIDFNGFFAVFHSLFFAEGTWTFSWNSLLITSLPLPFWMGMAGLWLGVAALLSVVSIVVGVKLRRRSA